MVELITLLTYTLKRFGISAKVFKSDDASNLEELIDNKTKAIFFLNHYQILKLPLQMWKK